MSSLSVAQRYVSNAGLRLAAVVIFSAIGPLVLLVAPALASRYIVELGLNTQQVGFLFTMELGAMAVATLPAYFMMRWLSWRRIACCAALLFIAGNLLTALLLHGAQPSYGLLVAVRFASAFAEACLVLVCMGTAATLPNAARAFGLWVSGQLVLAAVSLHFMPALFEYSGAATFFFLMALVTACVFPLVFSLPQRSPAPVATGKAAISAKAALGMLAVFLFYLSLSGIWTFVGELANHQGIKPADSAGALATATLMGIAGALFATWIGPRGPRTLLVAAGFVLMAGSLLGLLGDLTLVHYFLAACVFKFAWTYTLPFLMTAISEHDRQGGRLVVLSNLAICGGLAVGPSLAAMLLGEQSHFTLLLWTSVVLCAASFLAIAPLTVKPTQP
ncbi:MFS transporter [Pseudomonas sp. 1912-s]|uniref:MFS transporter n=1 Tax=Pseudomonas sp. 1912-s TaxID=3033802 RepID=UPI0023DFCBAB|nr:MFS transporter [Pseudomonas sp. 1912-s]MDF3198365.1 MFS transporter [Pseudomonas sp. 1912-s]